MDLPHRTYVFFWHCCCSATLSLVYFVRDFPIAHIFTLSYYTQEWCYSANLKYFRSEILFSSHSLMLCIHWYTYTPDDIEIHHACLPHIFIVNFVQSIGTLLIYWPSIDTTGLEVETQFFFLLKQMSDEKKRLSTRSKNILTPSKEWTNERKARALCI